MRIGGLLRALLAMFLLGAAPARGAEVFVCVADRTMAILYDTATQKWDGRMFPADGRTWIVREVTEEESKVMGLPAHAFVVQLDGEAQIELVCREGFTRYGDLHCDRPRQATFNMGNRTMRYLYSRTDGYWTNYGHAPGTEVPVGMEIGRCKPLQ